MRNINGINLDSDFFYKEFKEALNYLEIDGVVIKHRDGIGKFHPNVIEISLQKAYEIRVKCYDEDGLDEMRKKYFKKNLRVVG